LQGHEPTETKKEKAAGMRLLVVLIAGFIWLQSFVGGYELVSLDFLLNYLFVNVCNRLFQKTKHTIEFVKNPLSQFKTFKIKS